MCKQESPSSGAKRERYLKMAKATCVPTLTPVNVALQVVGDAVTGVVELEVET